MWKGLKSDTEVASFLFDESNVDFELFHTTYMCWLLFKYACVSSSLGQRYQNMGEVLLGYGHVCFGAFKYQHRLAKIT